MEYLIKIIEIPYIVYSAIGPASLIAPIILLICVVLVNKNKNVAQKTSTPRIAISVAVIVFLAICYAIYLFTCGFGPGGCDLVSKMLFNV
ncbi:MAG: hypothetical protein WCK91_02280 [bacterium]